MISDREIVINRCQSTLCRHVLAWIRGQNTAIEVHETGSDTCDHVYDPSMAVSLRRDVLILHALWTVGRLVGEGSIDLRAHVLADSLGYRAGDAIPVAEIPLQLVNVAERELTWQGVSVAARVARRVADHRWSADDVTSARWQAIRAYLDRWQHHIM